MIADTPEKINYLVLCTLKAGFSLELQGMKNSRRSCYAILKDRGYKGNKQKVYDQLVKDIEALREKF
jgi:hypothetical protein